MGLISEPLSAAQADLLHAGSGAVAGTDAAHFWLDPSQVIRGCAALALAAHNHGTVGGVIAVLVK